MKVTTNAFTKESKNLTNMHNINQRNMPSANLEAVTIDIMMDGIGDLEAKIEEMELKASIFNNGQSMSNSKSPKYSQREPRKSPQHLSHIYFKIKPQYRKTPWIQTRYKKRNKKKAKEDKRRGRKPIKHLIKDIGSCMVDLGQVQVLMG